jgi:hypothetical protein
MLGISSVFMPTSEGTPVAMFREDPACAWVMFLFRRPTYVPSLVGMSVLFSFGRGLVCASLPIKSNAGKRASSGQVAFSTPVSL